jgi:hypothetical protein
MMIAGFEKAPKPYIETMAEGEHWLPDYYDQAIPRQRGFITDFIYHTRGCETPTLACIWTALWVMSSAIKREAWIKWDIGNLYTNQFIVIIGPAGAVRKTTVISVLGLPILRSFKQFIDDKQLSLMKHLTIIKDMTTAESLIDRIVPENKPGEDFYLRNKKGEPIVGSDGKNVQYRRTSECAIVSSELSTLLGRRSYQEGFSQLLLDLYDCHSDWDCSTLTRGTKTLRNMHTTLIAATTVDSLRSSLPDGARGDGFLSRIVPVYVPSTRRSYDEPFIPKNAPDRTELAKRLAWIASTTIGEYTFSEEAKILRKSWYSFFKAQMEEHPQFAGAWSRMDINLYKVAMLLRVQRYDASNRTIELQDLLEAIRIMDLTYFSFPFLMSQVDADDMMRLTFLVEDFLKRHEKATRATLMKRLNAGSEILTMALEEMLQRQVIEAFFDGQAIQHAGIRSFEEYRLRRNQNASAEKNGSNTTSESVNYTGSSWISPPGSKDPRSNATDADVIREKAQLANKENKKSSSEALQDECERALREILGKRSGSELSATARKRKETFGTRELHPRVREDVVSSSPKGTKKTDKKPPKPNETRGRPRKQPRKDAL